MNTKQRKQSIPFTLITLFCFCVGFSERAFYFNLYSVTVEDSGSSFEMQFCSLCLLSYGIKILDEGISLFYS
jgi:hypothetical protein